MSQPHFAVVPRSPRHRPTTPRDSDSRCWTLRRGDVGWDSVPVLTRAQVEFIMLRVEVESDEEARQRLNQWLMSRRKKGIHERSGVGMGEIKFWYKQKDFTSVLALAQQNPKETFQLMGGYLLPEAFRRLRDIIAEGSPNAAVKAIDLLTKILRMQDPKEADVDAVIARIYERFRATQEQDFIPPADPHRDAPLAGPQSTQGAIDVQWQTEPHQEAEAPAEGTAASGPVAGPGN